MLMHSSPLRQEERPWRRTTSPTHATQNPLSKRAGDAELAKLMTSYWISFVVNQDPNHTEIDGAPTWPNYRDAPKNIVFKRKGSFVEDDVYRKSGIAL